MEPSLSQPETLETGRARAVSASERAGPPAQGADAPSGGFSDFDRGRQNLSGWGRFPVESCRLYEPTREEELATLLRSRREGSYIARGLGRSYGDASLNRDQAAVSLRRFPRVLSLDPATGLLDSEAGASLDELIRYALPLGFFLPVTPGTRFVTVGGAIAADVHGKNHHRAGAFSNFVTGFELLTAAGERFECSRELRPEVFWATVGGMGLTGFVTRARIRLRPVASAYMAVHTERAGNLGETFAALEEGDRHYEYSVAWVDCLARGARSGRSIVMFGRHAAAEELPRTIRSPLAAEQRRELAVPFELPLTPLRSWMVRALNALYFSTQHSGSERVIGLDRFFYPLDVIRDWNRLYGPRGPVQYQVAVPAGAAPGAFSSLLARIHKSGRAAFLGVLKRFGEASGGLLSFPMAGCTLALDLPVDRMLPEFLHELDALVADYAGRVYLAKDATLSPQIFGRSYPRLDEFRQLKAKLDPRGVISSSLARRLKIVDG